LQEGPTLYLQLASPYGTVELKPKNLEILLMLEKIIAEHAKLVEQGPIELAGSQDFESERVNLYDESRWEF